MKKIIGKCKVCDVSNRLVRFNGEIYCRRHYGQIKHSGTIFKRTRYDPNEIVVKDDYAEIILYSGNETEVARAIIDIEDIEKIKNYKWSFIKNNCPKSSSNNKRTSLSHLIMNFSYDINDKMVVDHINGDYLDNRKENLRICTYQQNIWNRNHIAKNNKSGTTGVYWEKYTSKWRARIEYNGKGISLGRYENKDDAIIARKKAEKKYHKKYCPTNISNQRKDNED